MAFPDLHWLCRLLHSSFSRYIDAGLVSLTTEEERSLLISLSQVSRRIRQAGDEPPPHCARVVAAEAICDHSGAWFSKLHSSARHGCLKTITAITVALLLLESQFVRHSAGRIFLELSSFLLKNEDLWKELMHLLCLSLETTVFYVYVPDSSLPAPKPNLVLEDDHVAVLFRLRLVKAKWFTVAELLQILRNIFKSLDDKSGVDVKFYTNAVIASLSVATSNILDGIKACKSDESCSSSSGQIIIDQSNTVILGVLLQLLCSLSKRCAPDEANEGEHTATSQIIELVPKFFYWGLLEDRSGAVDSVSQFLRHKMMMLMIRLSDCIHQERATLALWLQLLWNSFGHVLNYPLCEIASSCYAHLEGSPFFATMVGSDMCYHHLQRQATFLLFKCTFNVINLNKDTSVKIFELSNWLERHFPGAMSINQESYLEECRRFAFSFLKCFLDEDDFLFEMLLLLLDFSHLLQTLGSKDHVTFLEEDKGNTLFHITSIFDPVHVFHLFLFGIHYDHSMLLDCLISKDSGVLCVRYLLRCLRIVVGSWDLFVKFVMPEFDTSLSLCKKRKVCLDDNDSLKKAGSSTSGSNYLVRRPAKSKAMITQLPAIGAFESASKCLLCLKKSIESLHKKNLFPYNPTALLRREKERHGWISLS
ncbi:uncharacterized protein LOC116250676 isoform X2 [Nymphaea colorata]|uniref:uncharacterized protein LOC116250676 isoform X2 n=1 Tax=Nymphaea colorata TaxID=210225 RepID=UPI00129DE873|nr:uncharacterized protein LOC116250676 isoform X2 [Nymphaea colorata]